MTAALRITCPPSEPSPVPFAGLRRPYGPDGSRGGAPSGAAPRRGRADPINGVMKVLWIGGLPHYRRALTGHTSTLRRRWLRRPWCLMLAPRSPARSFAN